MTERRKRERRKRGTQKEKGPDEARKKYRHRNRQG
jgi:hypothetical protein